MLQPVPSPKTYTERFTDSKNQTGFDGSCLFYWQEIYQLKATNRYTRPPIWGGLLVPASLTLEVLRHVLQVAMGWTDSHLHEFSVGKKRFGVPDPVNQLMDLPHVADGRRVHLFMVLGKAGAKARYTYNFGDNWGHVIVVEKVLQPEP